MERSKRKRLFVFLFVLLNIVTIATTALIEFSGSKPEHISLHSLKLHRLVIAVLLFAVAVFAETAKYDLLLRATTRKSHPALAFQVGVLGRYYDNVTPLGAGGQPFQIHYLYKKGIPAGAATSLPIAGFLSNQAAFILLALAAFIINPILGYVSSPVLIVSASIGFLFYVSVPLALVLFTVMPKTAGRILLFFLRIGHKLHLVKNLQATQAKVLHTLSEYRQSLRALSKVKYLFIALLLTSLAYQVCLCSLPYFILSAFGTNAGYFEIFFMYIFTYAAVTYVPTPGNAGAAEGTFYALFKTLDNGYIFWAMILWRFLSYYMFIILGALLHIYRFFKNKYGRGKPEMQE